MHRRPFAVPFALAVLGWTCALAPAAIAAPAPASDPTPDDAGARRRAPALPHLSPTAPRKKAPADSAPKRLRVRPPQGADREDATLDVDDFLIDPSQLDDPGRSPARKAPEEPPSGEDAGAVGDPEQAGEPPAAKAEPARRRRRQGGRPKAGDDRPGAEPSPDGAAGDEAPSAHAESLPEVSAPEAPPSPESRVSAAPAGEPGPVVIHGLPPRPAGGEMTAWHHRYRQAVGPLKSALGAVVDAEAETRPEDAVPACRRLAVALADPAVAKLLPVPDLAVDLHWKKALGQLDASARACRSGSYARTAYHLHQAGLALSHMRLALHRWGLTP